MIIETTGLLLSYIFLFYKRCTESNAHSFSSFSFTGGWDNTLKLNKNVTFKTTLFMSTAREHLFSAKENALQMAITI